MQPGDTLGDFELEAPLGRGGWGTVWSARHRPTRALAAIKLLPSTSERQREAVRREVEAVARLRHRHVVAVHDAGERGELAWFAMERAVGHLGATPPRTARVLDATLRALLGALAHAHARGVVHRDLKPSNLLWSGTGELRVADFGVARLRGRADGGTAGSPGWMAPEQLDPDGDQGPWTDLYVVGLLTEAWAAEDDAALRAWASWLRRPDPALRPRCAAEALAELPAARSPRPFRPVSAATEPTRAATARSAPGRSSEAAPALRTLGVPARHRTEAPAPDHLLRASSRLLLDRRQPELVGREAQQAELWRALRRAEAEPVAVDLAGGEGVGRSLLAEWLGRRAAEVGASVWWGRPGGDWVADALELEGAPIGRAARWVHRRGGPPELVDRVARGDPGLAAELLALEPGPRVVVADGAPAADVWAGARARGTAVLVVTVGEALEGGATIEVPPLGDADLLRALAELLPLQPWFAADLVDRCGGRPAVARRWLEAMSAAGGLERLPTGFGPRERRWRVPGPEQEAWRAAHLARPDRDLVCVAALRGRCPELDPRLRQAALEAATAEHARAAAEDLEDPSRRGEAWVLAGDLDRAAADLTRAVEAAIEAQLDYPAVLAHTERLLAVLERLGGPAHPRWRATVRNHMHCWMRSGGVEGSDLEAEEFLARDDLTPQDRASALSLRAQVATVQGRLHEALAFFERIPPEAVDRNHTWRTARCWVLGLLGRAEEQARSTEVPDPTPDLLRFRASAKLALGDLDGAEAGLALARREARTVELAAIEQVDARLRWARGDAEGAMAAARRATALAAGEVERLVPATDVVFYAALSGRLDEARAEAEPLLERARQAGYLEMEAVLSLASWATSVDAEQGLEHGREGLELVRRGVVRRSQVQPLVDLALSRCSGPALDEARRLVEELP